MKRCSLKQGITTETEAFVGCSASAVRAARVGRFVFGIQASWIPPSGSSILKPRFGSVQVSNYRIICDVARIGELDDEWY